MMYSYRIRIVLLLSVVYSSLSFQQTALDHFDKEYDHRIDEADKIAVVPSHFSSHRLPPIVTYEELQHLSKGFCQQERKDFVNMMRNCGGCFLLKFDKESQDHPTQHTSLENMWKTMDQFYDPENLKKIPNDILAKQHKLPKNENDRGGGYDFIQTCLERKSSKSNKTVLTTVPKSMESALSTMKSLSRAKYEQDCITASFHLLANLSKMIALVVTCACLDEDPIIMDLVLDEILDDFSCCNHRLCRYHPTSEDKVLLRSHTDWTLITCTPVKTINRNGLILTYNPTEREWFAPDFVTENDVEGSYILIMGGKSLDQLVNQHGLACIHQVISCNNNSDDSDGRAATTTTLTTTSNSNSQQQRFSAPFFLRCKESISQEINKKCNANPCSKEESLQTIHRQVFQNIITKHKKLIN